MSHDEPAEVLTTPPPPLHQTSTDESEPIAPVNTDEVPSLSQLSLDTSASEPTNEIVEHSTARDAEEKQLHPSEDKPEGLVTECVDSVSLEPDVTQEEAQETEVEFVWLL